MKKNLLALGLSLFAFGALMADDCYRCDPCPSLCDVCDPCEGWSASVDWLYWKVRRSGLDYAVQDSISGSGTAETGIPDGKILCVEPKYQSGVRAAIFKACDDFDFGVRWTHFSHCEKDSHSGYDIFPTRGVLNGLIGVEIDSASAKYEIDLNYVDVEAGYLFRTDCDGLIRPFGGFRYASINQELTTNYDLQTGSTADSGQAYRLKDELDLDAYGLYVGFEGNMEAFCNIGIFGRFQAGLYLGDFDIRRHQYDVSASESGDETVTPESSLHHDCSWHIVPNWEIAAGLSYDLCDFFCADWNIEVGYEFHEWCCLPDFLNFVDDADFGRLGRNQSSLGFDGLFVRLNATF